MSRAVQTSAFEAKAPASRKRGAPAKEPSQPFTSELTKAKQKEKAPTQNGAAAAKSGGKHGAEAKHRVPPSEPSSPQSQHATGAAAASAKNPPELDAGADASQEVAVTTDDTGALPGIELAESLESTPPAYEAPADPSAAASSHPSAVVVVDDHVVPSSEAPPAASPVGQSISPSPDEQSPAAAAPLAAQHSQPPAARRAARVEAAATTDLTTPSAPTVSPIAAEPAGEAPQAQVAGRQATPPPAEQQTADAPTFDPAAPAPARQDVQGVAETGAAAPDPTVGKASSAPAVMRIVAPPAPPASEAEFAQTNHPTIVSAVRGQLLPNGGTMHLRLDPPELGALQVTVRMSDGVISASFQTSSDEATRLLSHSLGQLKRGLESQGVSVDRIQVQQSPRDEQTSAEDHSRQPRDDDGSARQEQQRKELLRRMWRRVSLGSDPLDLVA